MRSIAPTAPADMAQHRRLYRLPRLFKCKMHLAIIPVPSLLIAYPFTPTFGQAADAHWTSDESLKIHAVGIKNLRPFREPFTGFGVYLGHGLVLTAAHVVSRWSFLISPRVLIAGQEL